jgi:hypothetical protein
MRTLIFLCAAILGAVPVGAAFAQGVPSLPIPGAAGPLDPSKNAPPPPTKKLPNGECVAPGHPTYRSLRNFVPFVTLEDCLKSGGRQATPGIAMGLPPTK